MRLTSTEKPCVTVLEGCNAQLYTTYIKAGLQSAYMSDYTMLKIEREAQSLGVSEIEIMASWLNEMAVLHG